MFIKILVSLILGMAFSSFYYIYNFKSKNKGLVIIKTIIFLTRYKTVYILSNRNEKLSRNFYLKVEKIGS